MKKLFTLLLAAACFTASAQIAVEYPYNPDNQNDGHVGIEDILEILTVYGEEFTPEQLMVEGTSLTEWIQLLSETVIQQQAQIDSLESSIQEPSVSDSLIGDVYELIAQQQEVIDSMITLNSSSNYVGEGVRTLDWPVSSLREPVFYRAFDNPFYEVPEGLGLILLEVNNGWVTFEKDGIELLYQGNYPKRNFILEAGDVLHSSTENMEFVGILCDLPSGFDMIAEDLSGGNTFVVPEGKIFVPVFTSTSIYINDPTSYYNREWNPNYQSLPLIAGSVLSSSNSYGLVYGYLVEDSFFSSLSSEPSTEEPIEDNLGPCQGEFTVNYHGYDYELVEIGDQCWFAENLRTRLLNNGQELEQGLLGNDNDYYTDGENPSGYQIPCISPSYNPGGATAEYWLGLGYSGFTAVAEDVCPTSYHVPTMAEFDSLITGLGGTSADQGIKLLAEPPWAYGNNAAGFNARVFGGINSYGCLDQNEAAFLSSDITGLFNGFVEQVGVLQIFSSGEVELTARSIVEFGAAIRCIKD